MGTKRRLRNTSPLRGPVAREVLDRYAVKDPTSWEGFQFEEAAKAAAAPRKRRREEAA